MKQNTLHDDNEPLSSAEMEALAKYEAIYQAYEHSPFEAGRALQQMRDDRLYRPNPSFEGYCLEQLECSRDKADRLIWAWAVYQILLPIGVALTSESQARELTGLSKEEVIAAGKLAVTIASGKKLTAKHFKQAADQIKAETGKQPSSPKVVGASAKTVKQVLALVSAAEAALIIGEVVKMAELLVPFCRKLGITVIKAVQEYIAAKTVAGEESLDTTMKEYLNQPRVTKARMAMPDVIKDFLAAKKNQRGCKPKTLLKVYYVLNAFSRRIKKPALADVTKEHTLFHTPVRWHRPFAASQTCSNTSIRIGMRIGAIMSWIAPYFACISWLKREQQPSRLFSNHKENQVSTCNSSCVGIRNCNQNWPNTL